MVKRVVLSFMQAHPQRAEAVATRPSRAAQRVPQTELAPPALDYTGRALSVKAAATLRALHAPKDDSKTVWF
jgi:hypothetical protein